MTSKNNSFIPFAIISGIFAALSSVFAKLFSDERTAYFHAYISSAFYILPEKLSLLVVRGICFILIFVCNSVMWTTFTKALNVAPSSIQVSIVNGAINFSTSAILGHLVFREPLTLKWWLGASFILSGTVLLSQSQKRLEQDNQNKKIE
ncbi:uncharacterized protein BX663DRAFT_492802 [Cokeromyces recurvatus]|uniref:uncharacterized protein n=1 Tax=Cokeromyces recurvatus TaxID=90255 RepID=UPI002220B195|nr:uncharacterized protein BX663DRAFT_492802 [Cokeromyces recurvatus]KAI7908044.1 hypothetical protein BX663DRAFT_492802 [Cokeromyces recurvatus]